MNAQILNDERFKAMERGYRAQLKAVTKVFADILAEEMGPAAKAEFLESLVRNPPRPF